MVNQMRVVQALAALICFSPTYLMGATSALVFNSAPINHQHLYTKQILEQAYESLGLSINMANFPYHRGAVSANYGVIDGLMLRRESDAQEHEQLIKINVPLLRSKTLLVINKALCGDCKIDKLISLASVSGFRFANTPLAIDGKKNYLIELPSHPKLFKFFERGRVNAIVTADVFLPERLKNNDKYLYIEMGSEDAFHYVHSKHISLANKLELKLTELKSEFVLL
jgi:hypothetical protein